MIVRSCNTHCTCLVWCLSEHESQHPVPSRTSNNAIRLMTNDIYIPPAADERCAIGNVIMMSSPGASFSHAQFFYRLLVLLVIYQDRKGKSRLSTRPTIPSVDRLVPGYSCELSLLRHVCEAGICEYRCNYSYVAPSQSLLTSLMYGVLSRDSDDQQSREKIVQSDTQSIFTRLFHHSELCCFTLHFVGRHILWLKWWSDVCTSVLCTDSDSVPI